MTTYINGNSRLLVEHHSNTYILQHPQGNHNNWVDSLVASSPEDFLQLYLDRNIRRIKAQPRKMATNVKTVLTALCDS